MLRFAREMPRSQPRLPFPMAPFPEEYPGKTIWFTLRFVGDAPSEPPAGVGRELAWSVPRKTEWVDGASLAIGDVLLDGAIVAQTQVGGAPCWKIDTGTRSF